MSTTQHHCHINTTKLSHPHNYIVISTQHVVTSIYQHGKVVTSTQPLCHINITML
eukprot:m.152832 g.152832  ORF g.152832 m.152832 type:complete len:55 (-) comp30816_c0_seq1:176-340(-)